MKIGLSFVSELIELYKKRLWILNFMCLEICI